MPICCHTYIIAVSCGTIVVSVICGQRNKRSLRFVFNDNDSNYMQLLNRVGQPSLFNGRVHYILTLVYKSLNELAPEYITNMFSFKTHSINLRTSTVVHTHLLSLVSIHTPYSMV